MLWACATPEREEKSSRVLQALCDGWHEPAKLIVGMPPDDRNPIAVWGQKWLAEFVIPRAMQAGRDVWQIDNGFIFPVRNGGPGYHRITLNSPSPVLIEDPDLDRMKDRVTMKDWRKNGEHVLIALPGKDFGRPFGMDMNEWIRKIRIRVRMNTDRRIIVRPKKTARPIQNDLKNCWALVTHSSNAAIDAILQGIPVFVEPTSPAAPVGNFNLSQLHNPLMPDRTRWLASLLCQQFTNEEFRAGVSQPYLKIVKEISNARNSQL